MKFYKIEYGNWGQRFLNGEQRVEWATNKRDAERIARENDDGDYKSKITRVDVTKDTAAFLALLDETCW